MKLFQRSPERVVPKILGQLCSGNLSPTQHLETQQALVKQLAEILEFVLKFDEFKMKTPAIQNDFSYYRRTLSRASLGGQQQPRQESQPAGGERDLVVGNELANRMSLFYAHATPMLRVLSNATIAFLMDVSLVRYYTYMSVPFLAWMLAAGSRTTLLFFFLYEVFT